jgi:hypothetical protein
MGLGLRGVVILRLCWPGPDGACSGESVAAGIKPRTAVSHCQAAEGSVTPGGAVRRRARHRSGRIKSSRGPVRYLATSDSERRDSRPRPCLSLRSLAGRYLPARPQKARQQWAHAAGCQCLRCRNEARSACMVPLPCLRRPGRSATTASGHWQDTPSKLLTGLAAAFGPNRVFSA